LGKHPAVQNQLFVVIAGAGEVCGADGIFHPIEAGMVAFWEAGEEHETLTTNGLSAIAIEGENLQPGERLEEIT
jgi:mannose-6-phosphate isomerase-like protein (cupin superfamily)